MPAAYVAACAFCRRDNARPTLKLGRVCRDLSSIRLQYTSARRTRLGKRPWKSARLLQRWCGAPRERHPMKAPFTTAPAVKNDFVKRSP